MSAPHDRAQFERLVRDHHAAVFRSARRVLRDDSAAMDVTQDVFLELLRRPERFAGVEEPGRALRWMAAKKALFETRGARNRRRRESAHAMERIEAEQDEGYRAAEGIELRELVARGVEALPRELRAALHLRFEEGMTYAAIAEASACSEPTAHDRVRRALERLRLRLERAGHATPAPALVGLLDELGQAGSRAPAPVPAGLESRLLALASGAASAATLPALVPLVAAALLLVSAVVAVVLSAVDRNSVELPEVASIAPANEAAVASSSAALEVDPTRRASIASTLERDPRDVAGAIVGAQADSALSTGVITGLVVDPDRRPIAGADVRAHSVARSGKLPRFQARALSDADGRFRLEARVEDADGQAYVLSVAHPDLVRHQADVPALAAGESRDLGELVCLRNSDDLVGHYQLTAHVVDDAGAPVDGAVAIVSRRIRDASGGWTSEKESSGLTDASGRVELAGEHLGEKLVIVRAHARGFREARFELAIELPGPAQHAFVLERGLSIAGRVSTIEGEALPVGVQVHAVAADPSNWLFAQIAPDGRFEIGGLDEGAHVVHVRADGRSPARVELRAGETDARIVLKRVDDERDVGDHMAEIHGRVVDAASGEPVAIDHWAIDMDWLAEAQRALPVRELVALHRAPRQVQRAAMGPLPEPSDRFHQAGLDAGSYLLIVRVRGYAPAFAGPIALDEGEIASGIELRLERGATLAGTLVGADGAPLAGGFVWLGAPSADARAQLESLDELLLTREATQLPGCVQTDERGRFRFEHLPPGVAFVSGALHARWAPELGPRISLSNGEERTDFALRLAARR